MVYDTGFLSLFLIGWLTSQLINCRSIKAVVKMAATFLLNFPVENSNKTVDPYIGRIRKLYPAVDETETPLPKQWNPKDKFNYLGLSQNNLRVHYKGGYAIVIHGVIFIA